MTSQPPGLSITHRMFPGLMPLSHTGLYDGRSLLFDMIVPLKLFFINKSQNIPKRGNNIII